MPGTRPKLMHFAHALIASKVIHPASKEANPNIPNNMQLQSSVSLGYELRDWIDNAYRRVAGAKPSRAAHYKRIAKKRATMRARGKK